MRVIELIESSPEPPPFPQPPTHASRQPTRTRVVRALALASAVAIGIVLAATVFGGPDRQVAGAVLVRVHAPVGGSVTARFPRSAISEGKVNWGRVSRMVEIVNESGVVLGYMLKSDLDGVDKFIGPFDGGTYEPACGSEGIDVYNESKSKVLGAYYPNAGFVPTGTKPTCRRATPMLVPS
jgi:hypothetical protein